MVQYMPEKNVFSMYYEIEFQDELEMLYLLTCFFIFVYFFWASFIQ